jgi:hypothetical protein
VAWSCLVTFFSPECVLVPLLEPEFRVSLKVFTNRLFIVVQIFFLTCSLSEVGRDSSVGIATHYGLDGPGIESRWGRDFLRLSRPVLGPTQPPIQWVPGLSRE